MKKYSVLLLFFFVLCVFITSSAIGQSSRDLINIDSLVKSGMVSINSEGVLTLNNDTIFSRIQPFTIHGSTNLDSMVFGHNGIIIPDNSSSPSLHYYPKGDKRYYIENVPPKLKGKEIDHSNIWLLNDDVPGPWH